MIKGGVFLFGCIFNGINVIACVVGNDGADDAA